MRYILIAVLSVLFFLAGCDSGTNGSQKASQVNVASSASSPTTKKFTLSENEEKLLRDLLDDEIETFFAEGDTILGEFLPRYSPDEISKDFEQNEVRALGKYKNNVFVVIGKIANIQAGINDEPFVVLQTSNQFDLNRPQARFDESDHQKIAELNKGDTIKLLCSGNGEVGGTPMLGCTFTDNFKAEFTNNVITNIHEGKLSLEQGARPSEKMAMLMLIYTKTAADYTDNFKSCAPKYETKCLGQSINGIPRERFAEKAKEYGFSELAKGFSSSASQPK
ncbi:hypothetical protein [Eikenella halliae]|uniref:OB-fold protein n=1 Tax=Eikenella halliae TaxID=1795832 RepID=UPI003619C756